MQVMTCSIKEAIRATSLSQSTVYRMIDRGELETVKLGGRRLVKMSSLKRLLGEEVASPSGYDELFAENTVRPNFPESIRELRAIWPKHGAGE